MNEVLTGAFDWFLSDSLPEGEILVESGLGSSFAYQAQAGDLVMALWFWGMP